ncbi:hypothetical protein SARC_11824 [Sphaeroforma arctica JP610]|uniref:Protein RFT1 homolog n=1 Tax=Sphaeroforma arctica JP610 TaxID=667725 RepID=A0A0L0FFY5_9EUKA|nr:hypothetical protein SARC_11824 [Sphaeroforma arctica JP610]KNC75655.1 hypothetical protein SARC_11824 [Sphaeroforma arctica JP610]|eukprot:XP_014149557.1 hypothetical protein SARC_11824 [Sphaeroforma arctica JP610]
MPNYESSVAFFAIATLLELACEPMWIFCHAHFLVGGRVLVEGASLLVRCIVTVVLVVVVPEWGLNIFGIAACVYASCLIVGWISYVRYQQSLTTHVPPLPVTTLAGLAPSTLTIDAETKKVVLLTFSFTKQSFLKQFLTEGERYVMTLFAVIDFGQQGVFDVVSNLGSLVARFLFQPIEESYYLFFTSILSRDETHESIPQEHSQNSIQLQQPPTRATWLGTNQEQPLAGVGVAEHTHTDTHPDSRQGQSNTFAQRKALAARALVTLLKFVGILGLVFVCFGPSYTTILLDMYGGQAISIGIGPALLSWYCLYVLVLGINGITECFLLASADRNTIEAYNRLMVGFSVVYLAASLTLTRTRLQAAGFIVANCLNMCLRIAYGLRHALQYFAPRTLTHPQATAHNTHPLYQAVPSFWLLCTLVASGLVTQVSHALLLSGEDDEAAAVSRGLYVARAEHVLVGVCMLLVTAVVFAVTEKRFINDLKQLWRGSLTADVSKIE